MTGKKPADAVQTVASEAYTVANTQWMTSDGTALDPNGTFAPGTVYTVKVTLEANTGYAFQLKDFASTKSLIPTAVVKATKFQINEDDTVKAGNGSSKDSVNLFYTFTATEGIPATEYAITVTNGKATVGAGTPISKAAQGITITLTADAAPTGKMFDKWVVENGSITLADASSATTSFTMPASTVSVKATYKDAPVATYNLTTQVNGGHGTISASKTGLTAGSTETVIFTPDSGYEIDTVTVNGIATPVLSNVLDVTMDADKTVIVTYKAIGSSGHSHGYGSEWKNDATNHWHECSCGAKSEEAAHIDSDWITDTVATATTDGTRHKECTVCHRVLETGIIPATGSGEHTHNYSAEWKSDSINHWKECSCGDKDDVAAHSFKWVVDKEATETQKGSKHEECTVCGYKKAAVDISAIGSTTKPTDPSQTNPNTGANSPKTGDDSNMILWIVLLVASGLGITGTVVYSKRKKRKIAQ